MTKQIRSKKEQKVKLQATLLKMKGNEANFFKKVKQYRNLKKIYSPKEKKTSLYEYEAREVRK